jgi:hypothetical protein
MGAQYKVVIFTQQKRYMRYAKCLLDETAHSAKQVFQIQNRGGLLGDGVDRLELARALLFQGIKAGIL